MFATLKLVPRPLFPYHILSRLANPFHTLSPRLVAKLFSFGNCISSQAPIFLSHIITSCHSLSHLITAYPLGWKKNHFHLATFKLVPSSLTSYHILSPRLEEKLFSFGNCKISSQSPNFLSHLITPCHILSHLITPYPLGWKQNHFHLATLKLVSRPQFFYHILSRLVTP